MYSSNLGLGENKLQYGFGNAYYNVSASIADAVKADNALMFGANMTLPLNFKLKLVKYLKPDQYLANLNLVGAAS
jgi:hypothetical protein